MCWDIDAGSYRRFRDAEERALLEEACRHRDGRGTTYPLLRMQTQAEWPLWRILVDTLVFRLYCVSCTSPLEDAVYSDILIDVYADAQRYGAQWEELQPLRPPRIDMPTVWAREYEARRQRARVLFLA